MVWRRYDAPPRFTPLSTSSRHRLCGGIAPAAGLVARAHRADLHPLLGAAGQAFERDVIGFSFGKTVKEDSLCKLYRAMSHRYAKG